MRKIIARYTEELLYDSNQRTREAAIRILKEVGDTQSIAHLKKVRFLENLESFRKSTNDAIKAIRSRDDRIDAATPNEKEARIKALEERLETLEKDYKKLQDRY